MSVGKIVSPAPNTDPQKIPLPNGGGAVLIFLSGQVEIVQLAPDTIITIGPRGNIIEWMFYQPSKEVA
jgi:hypothetical protein